MPGRAGGDRGRAKSNAKKRNLDDALEVGLGAGKPDPKRQHAAAVPGHRHDQSTSNSSSFRSSGRDVKKNGPSTSFQSAIDALPFSSRPSGSPAPQANQFLEQPNTSVSAAKASGVLGASGASGATWGVKPHLLGGLFSGPGHQRSKQHRLSNGPPTSSSTSSDASSIPAGSTATLPTAPSKDITQSSVHSLRYGYKPATRATAGESNPQTIDKRNQEAHPQNTKPVATGPKGRQSDAKENVRPGSRLRGKRNPPSNNNSSDDGLYVEIDDEDSDIHDEENSASFYKIRRGSARLRARGSSGGLLKGRPDGGLDDEHETRHLSYNKTHSGKDYHKFPDEKWGVRYAKFVLFPDRYRLQPVPGLRDSYFVCPVRTCAQHLNSLEHLDTHFESAHERSEFNDNLDEKGTLELVGQRKDNVPGKESIIVSRNRRRPPVLTNAASTFQTTTHHSSVDAANTASEVAQPAGPHGFGVFTVNEASNDSLFLSINSSSSAENSDEDSNPTTPSKLERAMAESKVWARVAPLVSPTWPATITDGLETIAFIQAISLPLRNEMDMEWLAGTKNSHQRIFRALMSIILQFIGVEAHCKPCETRSPVKQRNCKVLPPEAAGLWELQTVYGSQCVNCYFFHATKPCEFPASTTTTKQTPIPVPTPPIMRPTPDIERSFNSPSGDSPPRLAASRPPAPSYSSYKATKADKPISESPVPIPLFASRGTGSQRQSPLISDESSRKSATKGPRRSVRVSKKDGEFGANSITNNTYDADEAETHSSASAALSAVPSNSRLASGELGTEESTAATSNLSSGDNTRSQLVTRAFNLFGDIGTLSVEDQATLWNQIQQMAGMLQTSTSEATKPSGMPSIPQPALPIHSAAAAEWEIAPGRLTMDDKHLAFSTSFLSREIVSVKAAQQLSPTLRVLNKSIAALHKLGVGDEEGWDCTCSVIRGVLKIKVGDVEARIGQGGVIVVEKECIITNVSHKEARIQMWWRKEDD